MAFDQMTWRRKAPALPANIKLGWKGLPGTNALAYYEIVTYGRKKFYNIGPWERIHKNF